MGTIWALYVFLQLVQSHTAKHNFKLLDLHLFLLRMDLFVFKDTSFFPILRLLLPQHDRDRGPYGLKETALAKLYVRVLCLGKTSQDAQKLLHYK